MYCIYNVILLIFPLINFDIKCQSASLITGFVFQIMFSFLSVGWGLLSDIDLESERFRAIGGQRFTIWSIARLLDLRTYKGKVWYLPASDNVPISTITKSYSKDSDNEFIGDVSLETTGKKKEEYFEVNTQINLFKINVVYRGRQYNIFRMPE